MQRVKHPAVLLLLALVFGILCGFYPHPLVIAAADTVATIFVNLLQFISLPLIFLAIVSTITQMNSKSELKLYGGKVLKYTLLTTILAATVGLALFIWIDPVAAASDFLPMEDAFQPEGSYWDYLIASIPSNPVTPFVEGNVIAILLMALLMSAAIMQLPEKPKTSLNELFTHLFAAILEIAKLVLRFIPIAIWAFITQFIEGFQSIEQLASVGLYLLCVVLANVVQAFIVLPLFLKAKGLSPLKMIRAMYPACTLLLTS